MSKYAKKLGSDTSYKRPATTYQERLTKEEIEEKLQGYEQISDISEVPLDTHIRYFIQQKDGSQLFRTGGFLRNKQNPDQYIMLSNGKSIWSVQVANTVFFKKMSQKDEISALHRNYKKKIDKQNLLIAKLQKIIKDNIGDVSIDLPANRIDTPENPRVKNKPNTGVKKSKTITNRATNTTNKSKNSVNKSQVITNKPKSIINKSKTSANKSQVITNKPKSIINKPKSIINKSKVGSKFPNQEQQLRS